jgi:hypothetical protein
LRFPAEEYAAAISKPPGVRIIAYISSHCSAILP